MVRSSRIFPVTISKTTECMPGTISVVLLLGEIIEQLEML